MNDGMERNSEANADLAYAVTIVHSICCLAGSPSYIDDIRANLRDRGIIRAIRDHDTPALFDWLIEDLSFQGISDAVALGSAVCTGQTLPAPCRQGHRARSSAGTGGSTTAGTIKGPKPVQSRTTSKGVPCPAIRYGTVG